MSEKEKCDDCYHFLKNYGIDCNKDCDYEEARGIMKKLMRQMHPDKHPSEKQKYTKIFQEISNCNDFIIRNQCMKMYSAMNKSPINKSKEARDEAVKIFANRKRFPKTSEETESDFFQVLDDFANGLLGETLILVSRDPLAYTRLVLTRFGPGDFIIDGSTYNYGETLDGPSPVYLIDDYLMAVDPIGTVDHFSEDFKFEGRKSPARKAKSPRRKSPARKGKTIAQKRAECKAQGLVYDTVTGKCRPSKRPAPKAKSPRRKSPARKGKTIAQKRAECKAQGLVYDTVTGKCRPSKRPAPKAKSPRRKSPARKGKTIAQKRAECKAQGLVYDTVTGKCRPSKRPAPKAKSPRRKSPARKGKTIAQKRAECKAQGLVYDTVTGKCRPSKRPAPKAKSPRRKSPARKGKTIDQKRAECKAQGLVYDTVTGKCRPSKRPGRK